MGLFDLFKKEKLEEHPTKIVVQEHEEIDNNEKNEKGKPVKSFCMSLRYDRFEHIRKTADYNIPPGYSGRSDMRNFYLDARYITYAFEKNLTDVYHSTVERVNIHAVKSLSEGPFHKDGAWVFFDVLLDYENYLKGNIQVKNEMLMKTFMQGVEEAADYYGWSLEPFFKVRDMIISNNYCNEWCIQKKIMNDSKRYYVKTSAKHSLISLDIFAELYDNKGNRLCRKKVFSEKPDDLLFNRLLGKAKWDGSVLIFYEKNTKKDVVYARTDFSDIMEV